MVENEKVMRDLTQTRRDVRSDSISATCIVKFVVFDGKWKK